MGVLGLTPFLQKNYSHIIHKLPNRLRDLSSKRLVIDGTLITQRLHYAPSPHPYRHVLGWYHLARELNENKIFAVCIFDGEKRSKAKDRELERRQETRRLATSRGNLELLRTKRLKTLKSVVHNFRSLDDEGKSTIAKVLSNLNPRDGTGVHGALNGLHRVGEQLRVLNQETPTSDQIEDEELLKNEELLDKNDASFKKDEELPDMDRVSLNEAKVCLREDEELHDKGEMSLRRDEHFNKNEISLRKDESFNKVEVSLRKDKNLFNKVELSLKKDEKLLNKVEVSLKKNEEFNKFALSLSKDEEFDKVEVLLEKDDLLFNKVEVSLRKDEGSFNKAEVSLKDEEELKQAGMSSRKDNDSLENVTEADASPEVEESNQIELSSRKDEDFLEEVEELDENQISTHELQVRPQDSSFVGLRAPVRAVSISLPSVEDLKSNLLSSYNDFRSSISKVTSLPLHESTPTPEQPSPRSLFLLREPDVQEELVLTKTQCELTLEEGKVWDELTFASTPTMTASAPPTPLTSTFALDSSVLRSAEDLLDALQTRSEVVADSYQRRMDVPTSSTYSESIDILEAMGVLCYEIQGEHEGEALASSLVLNGLADYVVSEDMDVVVYEAPMIRNFSSRNGPLNLIYGSDVRNALDLSKDSYIDFALLLGTDFSQRIKNVGPSRAYKFIKEYGTIESILDNQEKYQPRNSPSEYLAQINSARKIFRSLPPVPDRLTFSLLSTEFGKVDEAKVAIIMERCGLGKALMSSAFWHYEDALSGNYFDDAPAVMDS